MKLDIVKADPSGNTTILVLTPVEKVRRAEVSNALMALFDGWAEQVGFVSGMELNRLDMMGGEFCGNATLSLAAYRALEGFGTESVISVSGADMPVQCAVKETGKDVWRGRVQMPLPESVCRAEYPEGSFWTVSFKGMTHVIVPENEAPAEPEAVLRRWASESGAEAVGMLFISESGVTMRPLVYVRDTDSAVWEHGCASGTAAVGAYLAVLAGKSVSADISQPGGAIGVDAGMENGELRSLTVGGAVRLEERARVRVYL